MKRKFDLVDRLVTCFSVLFLTMIAFATMLTASFSVNSSDDYNHAVTINQLSTGTGILNRIVTSFSFMKYKYETWSGNFFSMFIQALFSPLNYGGITQLRIVMVLNAFLLLASLFVLLWVFLGKIFELKNSIKLLIIDLIMYAFISYRCYYETFTWYSGATSYSMPFCALLLSFIVVAVGKNKCCQIIACLLGFLSAGGCLSIAGIGCYISVLMCALEWIKAKKLSKFRIVLFASYFLGAVVDAFAPGNFARLEHSGDSVGIIGAVKDTFTALYGEIRWIFHDTDFIVVLLAILIIGIVYYKGQNRIDRDGLINYAIISALALLLPAVTTFPVVIGYGSSFLSNRTQFLIETVLIIVIANIAFVAGCFWVILLSGENTKTIVATVIIIMICMISVEDFSIKQNAFIKTTMLTINGTYKNYQKQCIEFDNYLATLNDQDAVISTSQIPAGVEYFSNFFLEEGWVNHVVRDYYGMKSLVLEE